MPTVRSVPVVLDTDVWSHLFVRHRGTSEQENRWRELLLGRTVCISAQTRAELLAWPLIRDWGVSRRRSFEQQLDSTATIPFDDLVIRSFANLTARARAEGHAIGQKIHVADRWVAASASAHSLPLLAVDGIYRGVPGLELLS